MKQALARTDGLTLVEVVIAIAILAFAMAAAGALAATTTRTSTEAGRRTQASTLATREAESVRSLQSNLANSSGTPDTLYQYLQDNSPGGARQYNGGDCFQFGMRQADSTPTGWTTIAAPGLDALIPFEKQDFEKDPELYFEGYQNFSRLVSVCRAEQYEVSGGYTPNEHILDMKVRVTWREADNTLREVKTRNVLSTPGFVDEE